jgi:hypothetical protein
MVCLCSKQGARRTPPAREDTQVPYNRASRAWTAISATAPKLQPDALAWISRTIADIPDTLLNAGLLNTLLNAGLLNTLREVKGLVRGGNVAELLGLWATAEAMPVHGVDLPAKDARIANLALATTLVTNWEPAITTDRPTLARTLHVGVLDLLHPHDVATQEHSAVAWHALKVGMGDASSSDFAQVVIDTAKRQDRGAGLANRSAREIWFALFVN